MNEILSLLPTMAAGIFLGVIFFGGLWWTVQKGLSSRRPALWFLSSLLLRSSVVMAGFYFVSGFHWERLLACLFGFFIARRAVMRLTRQPDEEDQLTKEVSNAT
ncbi:MAG: ATP synthase subunit I [Methanosarcina sp.]|nr:MAG: ATP synthase subunit I [Methanosarcina sp.]